MPEILLDNIWRDISLIAPDIVSKDATMQVAEKIAMNGISGKKSGIP
jgi:hypothetical protein